MGIHWKSFKSRVKTLRDVSSNIPKDFAFSKSPMGTPLDSIFFAHNFFFSYRPGPREVPKSKFDSVRWQIFHDDSLETREFWWVETLMGIQWFEVHRVWWSWGGRGWRQKLTLILFKIYYILGWGISQHILVAPNFWQKFYGFTAIWSQIFFRRKSY